MRRALACWLVFGTVVLGGCGGGTKSNGIADMTPKQILSAVKKAIADAKSVHISGSGTTGGTPLSLDLRLAKDKGGAGHVEVGGYGFDIVRIGQSLYLKANRKSLTHFAGGAAAQLLADRWFKVSASSTGFGSFTPLTDLQALMNQILHASGRVEKGAETKVDGQPVIALTDGANGGTLYVATTGPAYPLELKSSPGADKAGAIAFAGWDQPVTLTAPKGALDYSRAAGS
jgi:hypothetical protein